MNRKWSAMLVAVLVLFAFGPHPSARQGGVQAIKAEQNLAIDLHGRVVDVTFDGNISVTAPWDRFRFDIDIVQPLTRDGGGFLGDLTGDGLPDLVLAGFYGETLFFPGIAGSPRRFGNGSYVRQTTATASTDPFAFPAAEWVTGDVGDLDGDGIKEVAIGQNLYRSVGTPTAPTLDYVYTFPAGGAFDPAASFGDLNGDGAADVVISFAYNGGTWIYWNTSTPGSFSFTPQKLGTSGWAAANRLATADLNGDGLLDLAGAEGIYFNTGTAQSPVFSLSSPSPWNRAAGGPSWLPLSDQGTALWIRDVTGDGLPDVYVSNLGMTVWQVLFYKNTGTKEAHRLEYKGPVVASSSPVSAYYRGDTTPSFSGHRAFAAAGDIDQNGLSDVLMSGPDVPALLWSFPKITGSPFPPTLSFQDLYTYPAHWRISNYCGGLYSSTPRDALCDPPNWFSAWTDLTGDGLPDAVRGGYSSDLFRVARSGSWPFTLGSDSLILTSPGGTQATGFGVVRVDVDLDGRLDVVTGSADGRLLFYRNTATSGAVTLADPAPLTDSTASPIDVGGWSWPTAFDLDGDGDTDFLVADNTGTIRKVMCVTPGSVQGYAAGALLGTPEQDPVNVLANGFGQYVGPSLATMDVNGDGLQDVVMGDSEGRVWLLRNVGSSGAPSFSLGPLTISRTAAAYMEIVDARTVRLYFGLPVTPGETMLGYRDVPTSGSPVSGELPISPDADNAGVLAAAYDPALKVPACALAGIGCDSATLLNGVDSNSGKPEANQPNTLSNSCGDGTLASDSIERIRVTTVDGGRLAPGKQAKIEVTAQASSTSNKIDLYYTNNANSNPPAWTFLTTLTAAGGLNVFTTTYTLPDLAPGALLQAVRAHIRFGGSATPCSGNNYDDHDDLAFGFGSEPRVLTDLNGDGKSDALWHHATTGEVWLWPMDGAARLAESYVRSVTDTNWEIRGVADFTGDGKADILWRHKTTGMIYLWPMNGSAPISETYLGTVDPAYDIVGTGDFDADGKADILWRHLTNGEVWIWLMDGATPLSRVYLGTVDPAYVVKGVGDLDGDGKADIVWHHATAGEVWVWLMDGANRTAASWIATVPDVGYQIAGVADFGGDGKTDVLWHHATTGEVWLWRMDGTTRLAETWVGTVVDTNYGIVGTGDYDGDGKADILWRHATLGEVWVWLMDGATRLSQTWVGTVSDVGYQIVKVK
jgi:hypothetical protein